MRCKMCGAKLKKEGNVCKNCYQEYKKEQALKADNESELLCIKRKYSPKYNLFKNGDLLIICLIIALAGFSTYGTWIGILITILTVLAFGVWMFYNKKRASGTKTTFYETKLKFRAKYPLVDKEEYISYDDIKDMAFFQTRTQKRNKIGDIRFYTKGFLSGLTINDIPDLEANFEKIKDIINASRG